MPPLTPQLLSPTVRDIRHPLGRPRTAPASPIPLEWVPILIRAYLFRQWTIKLILRLELPRKQQSPCFTPAKTLVTRPLKTVFPQLQRLFRRTLNRALLLSTSMNRLALYTQIPKALLLVPLLRGSLATDRPRYCATTLVLLTYRRSLVHPVEAEFPPIMEHRNPPPLPVSRWGTDRKYLPTWDPLPPLVHPITLLLQE